MNNIGEIISTILASIVGIAILAVIVSKNAQTPSVIAAAGTAFSNVLKSAEGPVATI